ncbi:hypothetical protein BD311DRAFT_772696 [Dichomitus squalens]|uniref:Uncharacterized protein n=1 Tax=Dichomitus squalens TaxID=114155 RepID=A0A4Q9N6D8_9APHY|nr:hypothetical protein BD311DRAFT_772696 [Dichomitus squalens]
MRMFRDDGDLVLGIRPNGASSLLLPVDRYFDLRLGPYPRQPPWDAGEFESLSPIQFGERKELVEKLSSLVSNRKNKNEAPRDRSRANTEFTAGGDGKSQSGEDRSSFEHQRVLYRLLQKSIAHPEHFAVSWPPWFGDVQVYSFAFNLWGGDKRALDVRMADPRVLDVGWTEFDPPSDDDDLKAVSTTHLTVEEERYLANPGRTRLNLPDITQVMPRAEVSNLLQTMFAPQQGEEGWSPKLLLVHDEKMTKRVLSSLGVDTSRWASGIKHLLYNSSGSSRNGRNDVQPGHRDSRSKWSRERSRSPGRWRANERDLRPRSPDPRRTEAAPVYIIDAGVLYRHLMKVPPGQHDSILLIAKALSVKDTALRRGEDDQVIYEEIDPKEWCAGRESRLLGYIWESMAVGTAIDEQRAFRIRFVREDLLAAASVLPNAHSTRTDDGDVDPNDLIQPVLPGSRQTRVNSLQPSGLFDSDDEEWEDD